MSMIDSNRLGRFCLVLMLTAQGLHPAVGREQSIKVGDAYLRQALDYFSEAEAPRPVNKGDLYVRIVSASSWGAKQFEVRVRTGKPAEFTVRESGKGASHRPLHGMFTEAET